MTLQERINLKHKMDTIQKKHRQGIKISIVEIHRTSKLKV